MSAPTANTKSILQLTAGIVVLAGLGFWASFELRARDRNGEVQAPAARPPHPPPTLPPSSDAAGDEAAVSPNGQNLPRSADPRAVTTAPPRNPREIAGLRARITDESLLPQKRLDALRELRDCSNAWADPAVVSSMTTLLRTAADDGIRMNICRYLRGADMAEFRQQLINSGCSDPVPGVRREAVHSLRVMASDPVVQAMLKQALAKEGNAGVKSEIQRTLLAGRR